MAERRVLDWLLDGDPSVAWQVERDLLGHTEEDWAGTRSKVASEGWGLALLDLQQPDGRWDGGLYGPKWTSTNYTLLQLRRLGLEPSNEQARRGVMVLLDQADWVEYGVTYFASMRFPEHCVNGMILSLASYFEVDDPRVDGIAQGLIGKRLGDGGWNCNDYRGEDTHSSFHTTISVLEGLRLWSRWRNSSYADEAFGTAHEFMFAHRLFRSHTTGEVINEHWQKFAFPPRWHYDILRGLDHLRDMNTRDERAFEAIQAVEDARRSDGRWNVGPTYTGRLHFKMESGRVGGRWNTLRALRVLGWWKQSG